MTETEIKDASDLIAGYHGIYSQLPILQEECAELIQAVSKLLRAKREGKLQDRDALLVHVTEEIADVEIMLMQTVFLTGISRADVDAMKKYKILRELGNIKARKGEDEA